MIYKPNKLDQIDLVTVQLHVMQRMVLRRIFCQFVWLSVRPSVCQTRGLWQNERNLCSHSYVIIMKERLS